MDHPHSSSLSLLQLNGVHLTLDATPVLRDVSLSLAPSTVTVVLGPNGAGKSTLLKVACGEWQADQGSVLFNEQSLAQMNADKKALSMAVLPQQSLLTFPFTVREVVALGRTPHSTGVCIDAELTQAALQATDAWYLRDQVYTHLSGGEKQRVQMARVLVQVWQSVGSGNRMVVLDEPTSALDYAHQQMVAELLKQRASDGCAVLTAMHDLNLAAQCADQLILMCCGEIFAQGTVEEVLKEDILRKVFQVDFHLVTHPKTGRPWLIN